MNAGIGTKVLRLCALLFCLLPCASALAHVGSKDVFETVHAGPYTLYVTIRPPNVIPGVATVEVRSSGAAISALSVTPLPVTGEASRHPPAADIMKASSADPAFYTGNIWIMAAGTWQVRFEIEGAAGQQSGTVPVVAVPIAVLHMDKGMGTVLALLGLFLFVTMAGIIAASVGEARLRPGAVPTPRMRRRTAVATGASAVVMIAIVILAGHWWNVEAADYSENIYKPLPLGVRLTGNQLDLTPGVRPPSKYAPKHLLPPDTYLLDHGKVMHLYAIRWPEMDAAFHLHPSLVGGNDFRTALPAMPAGEYRLYGDIVHASGFPETLPATLDVPAGLQGAPLDAEDASASPAPVSASVLGASYKLPDGYAMVWDKPDALTAGRAYSFTFHLLDPDGKPAADMQPYLGMAGHAAFVKVDGSVFAHTHPEGSAAMADVMLANESMQGLPGAPSMDALKPDGSMAASVSFPYGFPTAGRYRIFIQMKHGRTVETGVFDAEAR